MVLILQINDSHLAENPPGSRTIGYCSEILCKLEWCVRFAKQHKVDAIVHTGDWFHSKYAHKTPYWLINKVIGIIKESHKLWLTIPGNHDYPPGFGDLTRQPYWTLVASGAVLDVSRTPYSFSDGTVIGGMEYTDEHVVVKIHKRWDIFDGPSPDILVLHQLIEPGIEDRVYEFINANELEGLARVILYGHVHDDHGAYKIGKTSFSNPGALSRGSLSEGDLKRSPQVALIDVSPDISIQFFEIPHKPIEECYLLDKVERRKLINADIDSFVSAVEQTRFSALSFDNVRKLAEDVEDEDVREVCLSIWDSMS